jgi:hypothetical protein
VQRIDPDHSGRQQGQTEIFRAQAGAQGVDIEHALPVPRQATSEGQIPADGDNEAGLRILHDGGKPGRR